jgi:hypothetical protein
MCKLPVRQFGLRKTPVGASAFVAFCYTTFFCVLEMLRISFIAHKKTSHITSTLGEITIEILTKFMKYYIIK